MLRFTRHVVLVLPALAALSLVGVPAAHAETDVLFFLGQKHMALQALDSYVPPELGGLLPGLSLQLDDGEEQDAFGIGVSYQRPKWPVALAVDVLFASGDADGSVSYVYDFKIGNQYYAFVLGDGSGSIDSESIELDVGVRKFWEVAKSAYLYAGAGPAWVQTDLEHTVNVGLTLADQNMTPVGTLSGDIVRFKEDDDGIGYWVNAGVLWRLKRVSVGLDLRWSDAEVEMTNEILGVDNKFNAGGFYFGAMVGYQFGRR